MKKAQQWLWLIDQANGQATLLTFSQIYMSHLRQQSKFPTVLQYIYRQMHLSRECNVKGDQLSDDDNDRRDSTLTDSDSAIITHTQTTQANEYHLFQDNIHYHIG